MYHVYLHIWYIISHLCWVSFYSASSVVHCSLESLGMKKGQIKTCLVARDIGSTCPSCGVWFSIQKCLNITEQRHAGGWVKNKHVPYLEFPLTGVSNLGRRVPRRKFPLLTCCASVPGVLCTCAGAPWTVSASCCKGTQSVSGNVLKPSAPWRGTHYSPRWTGSVRSFLNSYLPGQTSYITTIPTVTLPVTLKHCHFLDYTKAFVFN